MRKSSNEIVNSILSYINKCSGKFYSDYYVGISNDPRKRLFAEHNVNEQNGCWIITHAKSIEHARNAETTLLNKGMKGGDGGGDNTSMHVYCYMITSSTNE